MSKVYRLVLLPLALLVFVSLPGARFAQQATPPPAQNPPSKPVQNPAAEPATNQDVVRISTQLVQVDAVVTDKKGKHVEDLTEADFELLVDGKRQELTHFSHVSLPPVKREIATKKKSDTIVTPESMPTRQIAQTEVRRTLAFVVDDLGLTISSTEMVRETLRKFVNEQMQDGDLVAIIRTGNGLGMLEQFTSDKRLLYAAIERLQWNPMSRDMMPAFSDASAEVSDDAAARQSVQATTDEFRQTNYTTGTLGAVSFVIAGLRELPGRKSVILLSDGFNINSTNNDDNSTQQVLESLQSLVEQANRSSVVVYAIDAKGLQPFMPGANVGGKMSASAYTDATDSAQAALEGPTFLATQTGGFVVVNTNNLNIGIEEALYDQQSYYLIGFDPEDGKFDRKRHSIKLKVSRPGLRVRSRSGFFGISEAERLKESDVPKTRGQQLLAGLMSPLGVRDLQMQMTPFFFNASKDGPLVRTLFHLDCSKLSFQDGPNGQKTLELDLAAFAFDETGAPVDLAMRRLSLKLDEQKYQEALANGLNYRADFQLKRPGAYQLRAVLRDDATGSTGAASQFIQVPDLSKNRLALSGLVLTKAKAQATADAPTGNESAVIADSAATTRAEKDADKSASADLRANPYVRQFPRTGWIQYGAAIYNASTDKKTGKPQLTVQAEIFRDGKPLHRLPARALELTPGTNPKRFDYVARLRLNNFPAGNYLLHLVVTDGLVKKKVGRAEQWMDFSVQ
jgi:VWFA-related protein